MEKKYQHEVMKKEEKTNEKEKIGMKRGKKREIKHE